MICVCGLPWALQGLGGPGWLGAVVWAPDRVLPLLHAHQHLPGGLQAWLSGLLKRAFLILALADPKSTQLRPCPHVRFLDWSDSNGLGQSEKLKGGQDLLFPCGEVRSSGVALCKCREYQHLLLHDFKMFDLFSAYSSRWVTKQQSYAFLSP